MDPLFLAGGVKFRGPGWTKMVSDRTPICTGSKMIKRGLDFSGTQTVGPTSDFPATKTISSKQAMIMYSVTWTSRRRNGGVLWGLFWDHLGDITNKGRVRLFVGKYDFGTEEA